MKESKVHRLILETLDLVWYQHDLTARPISYRWLDSALCCSLLFSNNEFWLCAGLLGTS